LFIGGLCQLRFRLKDHPQTHQNPGAKAALLYEQALAIYEGALGPDHSNVALSLNNLA
jgi:hypothetical protein